MSRHVPVLLDETVEYLDPQPGQHFIDGTLGGGGHAAAILDRTAPDGKLLGMDLDSDAISAAKRELERCGARVTYSHNNFSAIKQKYNEQFSDYQISGILLDLGVSTHELEDSHRGFTFQLDQPLDMRFDTRQSLTAAEIVNTWPFDNLKKVIQEYGQERLAHEVTKQIITARQNKTITKTKMLVEAILLAFRKKLNSKREVPWIGGIHPATRTFQALRIAVNDELGNLRRALPQAVEILKTGGRVAVISFHSLEDRIVKHFFRQAAQQCVCPPEFPICTCDHRATLKILTKKPVTPSDQEKNKNPRSRSALLRVAEKV